MKLKGVFKEVTVKKADRLPQEPQHQVQKIITPPEEFQSKVLKVAKGLGLEYL